MTANTLYSNHSAPWNRHYDSMMASLSRRLEVARVAKDSRLVELLEQEKRQISTALPQSQPGRSNWVQTLKQKLADLAFGGTELRVCRFANGSDLWWYAIDPQTGHYVYADSEAELRLWIQQNYQGH
jgi:hypothetical protein